ncbi:MAG TPA: DUF58 domain-containing protein [Chitinophagales bacterium]|nr:DUF58 domain-containing protein [Chitinophagales bacterium]
MIRIIRHLYLTNRLFYVLGGVAVLFAASFFIPLLFPIAQVSLALVLAFVVADAILLFRPSVKISGRRNLQKIFSLGDQNVISVELENNHPQPLHLKLIDELPEQFQQRGFSFHFLLKGQEKKKVTYTLRPVTRGNYTFGNIDLMLHSAIGFCSRRWIIPAETAIAVYPSILQMRQFELKALARISTQEGIKKLRRLGHSYEFEEIKGYVAGDDYRSINWKASGRRNSLMVNQYEDERAQQVYSVIDRSRTMRMPFNGMSLLDYAINTTLVISNIALVKSDKAGLMTFADKFQTFIKAERSRQQLQKILEALYLQREETMEANYELLYQSARYHMNGRSLVFLYTNFESMYALERVLPILRRINRLHLLVVVFFQNAEVEDFTKTTAASVQDIYDQTIAEKFLNEKTQLSSELRRYGIQSILTRPEDLSINAVNKYLEFKSRGLI